MQVHLFGQTVIRTQTGDVEVGARNLRVTLAVLALSPGRPVSSEALMQELWGEAPPVSQRNALHANITRLRRTLDEATGIPGRRERVRGFSTGYRLMIEPGDVDVVAFESQAGRLLTQGKYDAASIPRLRETLAMWSAAPLMDAGDGPRVTAAVAALEELRRRLRSALCSALLDANSPASAARELQLMTFDYPMCERTCGLRMISLYLLGQPAAALSEYQRLADTIGGELGMRPSQMLRDLYQAILTDDLSPKSFPIPV